MYTHTEHAFMLNAKQKRGKERDEKELSGRARCAEGKRMNEWADGRDRGGVGGEKGMNRATKEGETVREQTRAERPGEEEESRIDCDR